MKRRLQQFWLLLTHHLQSLLNYLWCDVIILVISSHNTQVLLEKFYHLVPLKLWNCIEHIIRGWILALSHKGRPFLEKPRLLPYVTKWLKANQGNSNSKKFGNLTLFLALAAQCIKRKIRMASPGSWNNSILDHYQGGQALSLNAAGGQMKTYSRDESWQTFGPQTLKDLTF